MRKAKVYLSGPDRLRKDGKAIEERNKRLCEESGFVLLEYPEEIYLAKDSLENNRRIALKRLELIRECDILIGDVNDFRAYVEPFGETALELGMGYGLNKKMYGYMKDTRNCAERYAGEKKYNEEAQRWEDRDGIGFEPGCVNLMLEFGAKIIQGDLEDALKVARQDYYGEV